jgi:hypothetical protein
MEGTDGGARLVAVDTASGRPRTVIEGLRWNVHALALDANHVFLAGYDAALRPDVQALQTVSLRAVPRQGGAPLALAPGFDGFISGLAADGAQVFFWGSPDSSDAGAFAAARTCRWRADVSGHPAVRVACPPEGVTDLQLAEDSLYWSSRSGVLRAAKSGGEATLISDAGALNLAFRVEGSGVFVARDKSLQVIEARTGAGTTLTTHIDCPTALAVDERFVYAIVGCRPPNPNDLGFIGALVPTARSVVAFPLDGGERVVVAAGVPFSTRLAVDADFVYWSTSTSLERASAPEGY